MSALNCPRCKAEINSSHLLGVVYKCGSEPGSETVMCIINQRDQLRAQVETLKAELSESVQRIRHLHLEVDSYMAKADDLKAYAERFEYAGDSCCVFGPESVLKDWHKAKETKP